MCPTGYASLQHSHQLLQILVLEKDSFAWITQIILGLNVRFSFYQQLKCIYFRSLSHQILKFLLFNQVEALSSEKATLLFRIEVHCHLTVIIYRQFLHKHITLICTLSFDALCRRFQGYQMKTSPVLHRGTWNQERGRSQNQTWIGFVQAGSTWGHCFSSWTLFSWLVRYF